MIVLYIFLALIVGVVAGSMIQRAQWHSEKERYIQESQQLISRETQKIYAQMIKDMSQQDDRHKMALCQLDADWRKKYGSLLSQKKSQEVRTGKILEKVAPLMQEKFPAQIESDSIIPLFNIIDYLAFTDDEIVFCEIKSGNSQLSKRQRHVKKLIEEGKVSFQVFREKGDVNEEDGRKE